MADNLYDAVVQVESGGKSLATSLAGARGIMQITQPALIDYNKYNKTSYTMDDMYNPQVNSRVGVWYLGKRIPQMLSAYNVPDTVENRLWAYNAGIGNLTKGILPKETADYISKVKSLS